MRDLPCVLHKLLLMVSQHKPNFAFVFKLLFPKAPHLLSVRVPVLSDARTSIPDSSSSADSLRSIQLPDVRDEH